MNLRFDVALNVSHPIQGGKRRDKMTVVIPTTVARALIAEGKNRVRIEVDGRNGRLVLAPYRKGTA